MFVIGSPFVGKSSLIDIALTYSFDKHSSIAIEFDFYEGLTSELPPYSGTEVVLIVYDITN